MAKPAPFPFKKGKPANNKSVPSKKSSTDSDMAGEMARCMKQKGMTPSKCKKMMGGGM